MSEIIVCPSGLAGEVRSLRTKEADKLAGARNAKARPAAINAVLAGCWLKTDNVGPYTFEGEIPDWDQVLLGDRIFVLLAIRRATHGDDYIFKVQCPEELCNERFEWKVALSALPVSKLSEEDAEAFKSGNMLEAICPSDGKQIHFRLPTGDTERRAALQRSKHRGQLMTLALRMRIAKVAGVELNDLRKYISEMTLADCHALIEEFDARDCGVDTTIEIECQECLHVFEVQLPFDRDFFFPKTGMKKKGSETTPDI